VETVTTDGAARTISTELSVIVPAHDAAATLREQLEALASQEWPGTWEAIIVDNNSTDATPTIVAEFARADCRFRLVTASKRRGPAYARNAGAEHARGRLLLFCDADDVVAPGWLAAMGDALTKSDFVTGPQELDRLNSPSIRGAYGTSASRGPQTFHGIFRFGASANLGVRRELFDRLCGFDETLSVGEDIDFCMRAWRAGSEVQFVPGAAVHYRLRPSVSALWAQARAYGASAPAIAQRLARSGGPTPPRFRGLKNWLWLVRNVPTLRSGAGRVRWIVVAGTCVGRLIGSVQHRVVLL